MREKREREREQGHLRGVENVPDLVAQAIRNAIRANRFARIIGNETPIVIARQADSPEIGITRISDSGDSHESCESRH